MEVLIQLIEQFSDDKHKRKISSEIPSAGTHKVVLASATPLGISWTPDHLQITGLLGIRPAQAVELVKYHLGWKQALNLKLSEGGFHPTTLVYFRQRLIEHAKADLAMRAVLEALQKEGLVPKRSKQRLDSTHVLSAVRDLSALECVRETMRLALEELGARLAESEQPDFWELFWERYVQSKLDYRAGQELLKNKHHQAG
jgi:hypothetical protein